MKILIVDDSTTQIALLKNILEENHYEVLSAINGNDALSKLDRYQPDLVISDILMPEMDGYQLCKRIRQHPHYKNMPFILLSTLSDIEDIIVGLESGANYILNKPYTEEYLLKHLREAIEIHKIRQSEGDDRHVKVLINGREHDIDVKKSQIVDFLMSIYETAVQKNKELYNARLELEELNNMLEKKVDERTAMLRIESEERKRYEQQFYESQKLESIGQLTGGIAHDFNNLLLIALGNLEILSGNLISDSQSMAHINQAVIALERGSELTKHLLSFARKQALFPKSVDIVEHLNNIIKLLKPALSERIVISTAYDKHLWPVWIDPTQFENAIMNIAINARDAMHNVGKLHFSATNTTLDKKSGDYVKVSITDQGEGMSPDVAARIFEPFFTTKKLGAGTGLGLSMVYGFIKQSNGNITVESAVGRGTTFNLYIPRSHTLDENKKDIKVTDAKIVGGSEVILIAEDEVLLQKLVSTYLTHLGYQVLTASTGMEALEMIKSGRPIDLLFSDVIMPGDLTGPQLAIEARKISPQIKILLTSGYTKDTFMSNETVPSDIQHLTKPYKLDVLATKLRLILEERS